MQQSNSKKYNPKEIEKKWQKYWEENKTNKTGEKKDGQSSDKKFYILDMFPYPSGEGLHVGHPKGYIATDIYSRMKKMQGYDVLHPMGFDAFGLPAEQFAIKNKVNPNVSTAKNIARYTEQLKMIGLNYDWDREINTTDPKFYKWTQWMWKQMYKKGLAYQSFDPINWCPSCKTGLANEDLEGNACERCNTVVEKKPLRQWTIRITDYADRLLKDLNKLDWEPHIKKLQEDWIDKSEGSEIEFKISSLDNNNPFEDTFKVFTTRADTLFGCTYCVLAPEHKLVQELIEIGAVQNVNEVKSYVEEASKKSEIDRSAEGKEKTGVKLEGVIAINPTNQKQVPVYIADYVLASYGTGAIMAVPAHDERDREFAEKYNIEIDNVEVIDTDEERKKITEKVGGRLVTKYKLREWVFARQRYWGEPFPIVFATDENGKVIDSEHYAVADSELPVKLPEVENYEPTGTGESPLAAIDEFVNVYGYINDDKEFVSCDKSDARAKLFKRETNTMPQWAGSSWYYLRFIDPHNDLTFVDKALEKKWSPVDFYVGGAEHATRHLIYARFWHKFLYDLGLVSEDEPFKKLQTVGLIMAEDGRKMSKRWGNIVNPDDIIAEYGADSLRVYEMFMGPFDGSVAWSTASIKGVRRFLDRVWNLQNNINEAADNDVIINRTIKKVVDEVFEFKFNTAIAQMMTLMNEVESKGIKKEDYKKLILILAPFAPHMCEEIWQNFFGESGSVVNAEIPKVDESKLIDSTVTLAIQIGGKLRGTINVPTDSDDQYVKRELEKSEAYEKYVTSQNITPKKIIVVKNKIVNVVI